MHHFATVRLRCPICSLEFAADELFGVSSIAVETDFHPVHLGQDPIVTICHSCPKCRYAGYRGAFILAPSDDNELLESTEDDTKAILRPRSEPPNDELAASLRRFSNAGELASGIVDTDGVAFGAANWLLAARVYEFLSDDEPLGAAHYYLRAAWAARVLHDTASERRAQSELLVRLSQVMETPSAIPDGERVRLLFLTAETGRRCGEFALAVELFSRVEAEADSDDEDGLLLAALARRQSLLAQVRADVNAVVPDDILTAGDAHEPKQDDEDDDDGGSTLN